ncbi:FtsX-like permease family protein [Streptomyces sp. NPDC046866]|uniref:FtsX-like permease family protein n=1 Tax=Streptomyces sp. NPDC046866 TaxID=3154921 RepID=UPI003454C856
MLGFVVRRLRGRLPLAAAVLLTVLITTTALTALFAFTRGVGEAGLRQALQGSDRARTTVLVTGEHPASAREKDDAAVRAYGAGLFGPIPFGVESVARSRAYGLPHGRPQGGEQPLTLLAALDRKRALLLSGQWPGPVAAPGGPVPVSVPREALGPLGLAQEALPAEVRLDDRYGGAPLTVRVTGVYAAADHQDAYWRLDPLGGRHVQVAGFTTYGPLLADDSAFTAGGLVQNSRAWLLTPDFSGVRTADTGAVAARAAALGDRLKDSSGLQARSELPALLAELDSARLVARSAVLIGALQLVVLAAAALLLVAHLLADRQEGERVLLTARGASRARLGALGLAESLLLAAPAAVLAPLLAGPLLRLLGGFGPPARVSFEETGTWLLWPVAAGCALACVLLTTLPGVLRGAAAAAQRRTGRRQALVAGAVRSGADLALLALAVLAYRQLSRYSGHGPATSDGPPGAAGAAGRLGVDPVLVAAPTLALCAGTLLVLRLLPFAARLGGRIAARGRGLGPALVGWQLARRPGRATGPVLLLVLAVSSAVMALGQHTAWSASQRDQAEFATAGGLRITGSDLAPMGQGGRYGALGDGTRAMPVIRVPQELPGGRVAQVVALDAAAAAARVPLRADLRDGRPMRELFAPLAAPSGPAAAAGSATTGTAGGDDGIELPGQPRRIDLDVSLQAPEDSGHPGLGLLLRDRFGLTYRAPMVQLPDRGEATVSVDLGALTGAPLGAAAGPLRIAGMVVSYVPAGDRTTYVSGRPPAVGGELALRRISVADSADGAAVPVPVPGRVSAGGAGSGWTLTAPQLPGGTPPAELLPAAPDRPELLRLRYQGGTGAPGGVRLALAAPGVRAPAELSGTATRGYLAGVGGAVGDLVPVPLGGATVPVRITAAVGSLPVVGDTALAVDLASAGRLLAADARELPAPAEWWLPAASADDPAPAEAAASLRSGAGVQQVLLRREVAAGLLEDPLSAGPQVALAALAAACAVLAAIGFAASAAAAGRERAREFAVLLALGASRRSLARTAAAESCLLVGLGTAVGVALGAAIVHLVVPLVVLTPAARRPEPEVLVGLPVGQTLLLAAAVAAVPLLSAGLGARRGRNVADRLRQVEEA